MTDTIVAARASARRVDGAGLRLAAWIFTTIAAVSFAVLILVPTISLSVDGCNGFVPLPMPTSLIVVAVSLLVAAALTAAHRNAGDSSPGSTLILRLALLLVATATLVVVYSPLIVFSCTID